MWLSTLVPSVALLLLAIALMSASVASAQPQTTGGIHGSVVDSKTGDKLLGVTVFATSPSLPQGQAEITDGNGEYTFTDLPPGDYLVTFYYSADIKAERAGINVGIGKSTPVFQKLNQPLQGGESLDHLPSPYPVIPCPSPRGVRGWIRGTVALVEPATFGCRPAGVSSDHPGCVVGMMDAWCGRKSHNVTVSIGGAQREVSYPSTGGWQVCGLTPGRYALSMCSSHGAFQCTAEVSANGSSFVEMVEVEPRVRVHVDHVFVGTPSWAGRDLTFTLGNAQRAYELTLPPQVTLAWTEGSPLPHAYLCELPPTSAPGCGRCDARSDPGGAVFLLTLLAIAIGRRRR